jgi:plastocyanin
MRAPSILLAAGALALAGCGDDEEPPAGGGAGDAVAIGMRNIRFEPAQATVKAGRPVRWTNNEGVPHNVVAEKGADFESDTFGEGGTFEYTPQEPGTIAYVCTIPPGMEGTLTVEE